MITYNNITYKIYKQDANQMDSYFWSKIILLKQRLCSDIYIYIYIYMCVCVCVIFVVVTK